MTFYGLKECSYCERLMRITNIFSERYYHKLQTTTRIIYFSYTSPKLVVGKEWKDGNICYKNKLSQVVFSGKILYCVKYFFVKLFYKFISSSKTLSWIILYGNAPYVTKITKVIFLITKSFQRQDKVDDDTNLLLKHFLAEHLK